MKGIREPFAELHLVVLRLEQMAPNDRDIAMTKLDAAAHALFGPDAPLAAIMPFNGTRAELLFAAGVLISQVQRLDRAEREW